MRPPAWKRTALAIITLGVLLVTPVAQAEVPPLHFTYLAFVTRFYNPIHQITFSSSRVNTREIWVINDDGSGLQKLTNLFGRNDDPAWSPDGNKIAFNSDWESDNDEIYVMNSGGTNLKRLTSYPGADREPAWSPDGSRIVFTRWLTDTQQPVLFTMNADGTVQSQLTDGWDNQPAWSPDGGKIAFTRNNDIFIISSTGTNTVNLTSGWDSIESRPAWSPDGTKIAFVSNRDDSFTLFTNHIWTVNADGSGGFTQLTFGATDSDHPAYSHDGQRIVYSQVISTTSVNTNLWILKVNLLTSSRLTDINAVDASPDW